MYVSRARALRELYYLKTYPTISAKIERGTSIYAFAKLDGSSIRAEWSKGKVFYKFGSRKRLLGADQNFIHKAESLIKLKYEKDISRIYSKNNWDRGICFFEFVGPNSFAGTHQDETHDVVLFDVNPYKKGILDPKEYLEYFGDLDIAKLLYHGPCDQTFVDSVIQSTLEDMPLEGVVCKARNQKNTPAPLMFKIKSEAWRTRLWNFCEGDSKKFELLV